MLIQEDHDAECPEMDEIHKLINVIEVDVCRIAGRRDIILGMLRKVKNLLSDSNDGHGIDTLCVN